MKLHKKITALILVAVMLFCGTSTALAVKEDTASSPEEISRQLFDEGYAAVSVDKVFSVVKGAMKVLSFLTGSAFKEPEFTVTTDGIIDDACRYIFENSGFDMNYIFGEFPDINALVGPVTRLLKVDTERVRQAFYEKRYEADSRGDGTMSFIYYFLGAYFSVMENCTVSAVPMSHDPSVYEAVIYITFKDGAKEELFTGVYIDSKTGECYGRDNKGLLGTGFNFNLADMVLYATIDCWMRDMGFCLLYDIMANSMCGIFDYDTRRFKFSYDGLDWMIQIWKGEYFLANGGEAGLYNKSPDAIGSIYSCANDEQLLEMEMQVLHGDEVLVYKAPEKHWWANGFKLGDKLYPKESLTLNFSVTMPDEEMLKAFCESIDNHYKKDVTYSVDGLKVNVKW